MTHKDTLAAIRALPHMAVSCTDGEYRITYRLDVIRWARPDWSRQRATEHAERVSYYTSDREDAVGTAKSLSEHMDRMKVRIEHDRALQLKGLEACAEYVRRYGMPKA